MKYFDKNQKELKKRDVINLHQTVNGQNMFVVLNTEPLDIRYAHDLKRAYEYNKEEVLAPSRFTGETEWEIIDSFI
jgi:hypothetical protein